jgi:hypothetical protein
LHKNSLKTYFNLNNQPKLPATFPLALYLIYFIAFFYFFLNVQTTNKAEAARRQPIVDGSTVLDKPEVQREAAGEASATMPHDIT